MAWPDVLILIILALGTIMGFRRGLISELSGALAFAAAIAAAFFYNGALDSWVAGYVHLGPGSAHVVGMVIFALLVYTIVFALGLVLSAIAKLPLLGLANGLGGAAVGLLKSLVFVWVVVYVALFFPLSRDLRADLHRSVFIGLIEAPNQHLDVNVRDSLPWYVRLFSAPLFERHHV